MYADPDNNNYEGCHPDHRAFGGCKKTDLQCRMATSTVAANNGVVRHQFDFNGIPDHNAWGLTPGIVLNET